MKEHVALTRCFYCNQPGMIMLAKNYRRNFMGQLDPVVDMSKFQDKVVDLTPCSECEGFMKQGIILITIDPEKSTPGWEKEKLPNPWRTGGFFVLKEEAIKRFLSEGKLLSFAMAHRWMFIDHKAAEKLGFFTLAHGQS